MSKFTAQIKQFRDKVDQRLQFTFRGAMEQVVSTAQTVKGAGGDMPIDTGVLRRSLVSSVNGGDVATGEASYTAMIAGLDWGDTAQVRWTAAYARRMEYGFSGSDSLGRVYNQAGNFFVGNAVAPWQSIVAFYAEQAKRQI